MRRFSRGFRVVCLLAWAAWLAPLRAYAFGGVWTGSGAHIAQPAARAILVRGSDHTLTAFVQLTTAGDAERFAWLVPLPSAPQVGLSSNALFARLDAATAPQYWVEQAGLLQCKDQQAPPPPDAFVEPATPVLRRGAIGPYEYIDLTVDAGVRDAQQLRAWLQDQGFAVDDPQAERMGPYLRAGWHVLAFQRERDASASELRPLMLTYESAELSLPLQPAAGSDAVQVQLWIFGPTQAVPRDYASLVLNDARIDWLSAGKFNERALPSGGAGLLAEYVPKPSNYAAVVRAAAEEAGGQGFVTELADAASDYRDKVWSPADEDNFQLLANQSYSDGIEALIQLRTHYAGWDGMYEAVEAASTRPAGMSVEQLLSEPEAQRGRAQIDAAALIEHVREHVIEPMREAAAALLRAPYVTRLYSVVSADARSQDPSFTFNFDLGQVRGVHVAHQTLACSAELDARDAPWRIRLPQGGELSGTGSSWPQSSELPANLKVVKLSETGSGEVVQDNARRLADALAPEAAGAEDPPLRLPTQQLGLSIGGSQQLGRSPLPQAPSAPMSSGGGGCSVTQSASRPAGIWGLLAACALLLWLRRRRWGLRALALGLGLCACAETDGALPHEAALTGAEMTLEQLRDPETCKGCHPTHYRQWSASMHAYAARDPVFIAMNERGQRETHGELGDFCVKCHAPMAVIDKLTTDGLNLEQLADKNRGVSCYFCHNVTSIEGDHNALLTIGNDSTMRGPVRDPIQPGVHSAEYSDLFDDRNRKSAAMCGGCHDIRTPNGVHLERTFEEYRAGIFSKVATGDTAEDAQPFDTCAGCHMPGHEEVIATAPAGAPKRMLHEHLWPGVDLALTDFPGKDAMRSAVEDCQFGATSFSFCKLEVTPPDIFTFQLETNAGHNQPSGAAEDRRLWLEFAAYDDQGQLLRDVSSGMLEDHEQEEWPASDPRHDPRLLMFRDRLFDAQGKEVHMFWEAAKSNAHPLGFESKALPVATTTYIEGKHALVKQYRASSGGQLPARITARMRMRPIGQDVLQNLVASGDLDPAVAGKMQTLTFGTQLEWTRQDGVNKLISASPKSDCSTYHCLLDPNASGCQ